MIGWITSCFISHSRFISNPFGLDGHLISEKIVFEILKITPKSSNKTSIKLDEILRNRRHKKIVENIIKKKRRRGAQPLNPQNISTPLWRTNKIIKQKMSNCDVRGRPGGTGDWRLVDEFDEKRRLSGPPIRRRHVFFLFLLFPLLQSVRLRQAPNIEIYGSNFLFFFSKIIKSGEESTWPQGTFWTIFFFF